jgi:prevent-host-death family protein
MRTIAAGKFKATCLAIMDEVQKKRQPVLITKNGKPVAKLVPVPTKEKDPIFGFYKGKIKVTGDIVSPIVPIEDWDALK